MKKWRVAWTGPCGASGSTELISTEKEAIDWELRMQCWWPERKYRRVVVETRDPEQVHSLAGPYLKT